MEIQKDNIKKIAVLVSCASALQILESLFPHPIPGVRLGLPNVITLVTLMNIGFTASVEVAVLRTVISSIVLGTFLSPTFILSFSGALFSALVMGFAYRITLRLNNVYLSIVGISLLGAVTHNLAQLVFVYLLLIKQKEIFLLVPWLGISAVVMGWFNGLVTAQVCKRLENYTKVEEIEEKDVINSQPFKFSGYVHSDSPIHILAPEIKIIFVLFLAISALFLENIYFYLLMLSFFFVIEYLSNLSVNVLFVEIRKMLLFILSSVVFPILFNRNGKILVDMGILKITQTGLNTGILFAFRIILLTLGSSFLIKTTSPEKLISGLNKILFPFQKIGISAQRIATIIMVSLDSMPAVWRRVNNLISVHKKDYKHIPKLVPLLSDVIVAVYQGAIRQ